AFSFCFLLLLHQQPRPPLFPYTTLFRSALRAEGLSIAIDDFGTGYSNIARLRAMPLDRVKLDPSLIVDIESDEKARTVVQAVIRSEEHTSELQSQSNLVCRLLLEKKKKK